MDITIYLPNGTLLQFKRVKDFQELEDLISFTHAERLNSSVTTYFMKANSLGWACA